MSDAPMLSLNSIVARHAEQITAEIDGEVVVMGLAQGKYIGLDDVASTLWRLLEQPQQVQALCDLLAQHYRGDAAEMNADVLAFLEELQALGLIQIDGAQ